MYGYGYEEPRPQGHSIGRGDTMMSHFVRGRSNAIDWLEFRNLLISYLRRASSLEQVSTNQVMNKYGSPLCYVRIQSMGVWPSCHVHIYIIIVSVQVTPLLL